MSETKWYKDAVKRENLVYVGIPLVGTAIGAILLGPFASILGSKITGITLMGTVKASTYITSVGIGTMTAKHIHEWYYKDNSYYKSVVTVHNIKPNNIMIIKDKVFSNRLDESKITLNGIYSFFQQIKSDESHNIGYCYSIIQDYYIDKEENKITGAQQIINALYWKTYMYYIYNKGKLYKQSEETELEEPLIVDDADDFENYLDDSIIMSELKETDCMILLYIAIEKNVMSDIYNIVFYSLKKLYTDKDDLLWVNIEIHNSKIHNNYDIPGLDDIYIKIDQGYILDIWEHFLFSYTVYEKLNDLVKIQHYLSKIYNENYSKIPGSEELFPLFCYAVLISPKQCLYSQLIFLNQFHKQSVYNGIYEYMLTVLNAAIHFFLDDYE